MFIKIFSAIALTGALWVGGDAAIKSVGCCYPGSFCCDPPRECCFEAGNVKTSGCCASKSTCCSAKSTTTATAAACCNAAYVYCTLTGEVYEGCCCEIVNGQHHCLITGTVSDECCCIPLD